MNAAVIALESFHEVPATRLDTALVPREAQRMEAIGRFASGIVHDFNGVLASLGVYADMLVRQAQDAHQKQCAERMVAAAARGRNLVAQLLTYARSERTPLAPIDVCASARSAIEMVRDLAAGNVSLIARISTEPLITLGDATQLEQVVVNLCTNALQAMPDGGTLRVAVESLNVPHRCVVSHGAVAAGRHVMIRVEDEGHGMDEATLARAFDPFFTTRGSGRGTGLGLAIVQAIVERLGGAIDVQSTRGKGTCFSIYLPLAWTLTPVRRAISAQAN